MEDAVPTGADKHADDDQYDTEDDLTLKQLDNSDDHEDGGNQPEECCVHSAPFR